MARTRIDAIVSNQGRRAALLLGFWAGVLTGPAARAQTTPDMQAILQRLDRLEAQNQALKQELENVKKELAAVRGSETVGASASGGAAQTPAPEAAGQAPTLNERVAVQEARTAEQAQSKVGSSQRFPLQITGMALFNTYLNSENGGTSGFPTLAASSPASAGATFRQTVLGLDYDGPTTFWNGKVSGSLRMDFYGGSGELLDQTFRLRTADIAINWQNRSIMTGLDTSLLAQRQPESLAQVGVLPLTDAGNLWLWLPQARFEQDFHFGASSGVRAQVAAVETLEGNGIYSGPYGYTIPPPSGAPYTEPGRPGVEGRVEFFTGTDRRFEIAPGFHRSVSHVGGSSAPSDIYSVDWLARTGKLLDFTGMLFAGTNTAPLGGLQQGVLVLAPGFVRAVHSTGGWGQLAIHATPRLWFNLFSGQEDPRNSDLGRRAIGKNLAFGANLFFRLAPNILASFEAYQYRTTYIRGATLLTNHYDLALAYQF